MKNTIQHPNLQDRILTNHLLNCIIYKQALLNHTYLKCKEPTPSLLQKNRTSFDSANRYDFYTVYALDICMVQALQSPKHAGKIYTIQHTFRHLLYQSLAEIQDPMHTDPPAPIFIRFNRDAYRTTNKWLSMNISQKAHLFMCRRAVLSDVQVWNTGG